MDDFVSKKLLESILKLYTDKNAEDLINDEELFRSDKVKTGKKKKNKKKQSSSKSPEKELEIIPEIPIKQNKNKNTDYKSEDKKDSTLNINIIKKDESHAESKNNNAFGKKAKKKNKNNKKSNFANNEEDNDLNENLKLIEEYQNIETGTIDTHKENKYENNQKESKQCMEHKQENIIQNIENKCNTCTHCHPCNHNKLYNNKITSSPIVIRSGTNSEISNIEFKEFQNLSLTKDLLSKEYVNFNPIDRSTSQGFNDNYYVNNDFILEPNDNDTDTAFSSAGISDIQSNLRLKKFYHSTREIFEAREGKDGNEPTEQADANELNKMKQDKKECDIKNDENQKENMSIEVVEKKKKKKKSSQNKNVFSVRKVNPSVQQQSNQR